jgi:hypothetical protein
MSAFPSYFAPIIAITEKNRPNPQIVAITTSPVIIIRAITAKNMLDWPAAEISAEPKAAIPIVFT